MFVLFIVSVFQFMFVKSEYWSQIPNLRIQMSLQHVNKLLADIDDIIIEDRTLISQLDDNYNGQSSEAVPEDSDHDIQQLVGKWLANDTEPTATPAALTKHNFKQKIKFKMAKGNVGYCYAAIIGIVDMITDKNSADVSVLIRAFGETYLRMTESGKLTIMGEALMNRVNLAWLWISVLPVHILKGHASRVQGSLEIKKLDADVAELLATYDSFFEEREGERLLDTVVELNDFTAEKHGGVSGAESRIESMIIAVMAPVKRVGPSNKIKKFVRRLNGAFAKRYPDYRRSEIDAMVHAVIEFEGNQSSEITSRRSMGKGSHKKSEYKKLIRHLMSKHRKLFTQFLKFFDHSEKRRHCHINRNNSYKHEKNRYSRKKSHHHKHGKKNDAPKRRLHEKKKNNTEDAIIKRKEEIVLTIPDVSRPFIKTSQKVTELITQTIKEMQNLVIETSTLQMPHYRQLDLLTREITTQKRYSIVSGPPSLRKRINPCILTRRLLRGDDYHGEKFHSKEATQGKLTAKSSSARRLDTNNTILKKILGESSYSDEETYLRTMLDDAIMHGNNTIANNPSRSGRRNFHLEDVKGSLSESDAEWIIKNKIYNFFQQGQNVY